jgi:amino acid adenylation domain-containing protein
MPSGSNYSRGASLRSLEGQVSSTSVEREPRHFGNVLVPELVAQRSLSGPNDLALVSGNQVLTYCELNRRAAQISGLLRSWGVGAGSLVALCVERSAAFVTAALGILQSGAAYVPMDPAYPGERLAFMLRDARPVALVTNQRLLTHLPSGGWRTVRLDADLPKIELHSAAPVACHATAEDLAYVIYTSGSTGRPKGVEITHKNLLNLVFWHQQEFDVGSHDRASQVASPGFDAAVWELWPYLTAGASVHLADEAIRSDSVALRDWLVRQRITIAFVPTPLAERMVTLKWPSETSLRTLLTGADTLHTYPPRNLPFRLVNNYGPTECTVVATSCTVPAHRHSAVLPPIGRPISNVAIFILDEQLRTVSVGTTGEIYIGGAGVGRGYLNSPDLTAAKFVANPFAADGDDRLYRTGDLARYLPDGQISFQGRIDDQIKIRGYRIEPSEIVASLNEHPNIQASVVVARETQQDDKYLVAYILPIHGSSLSASVLRDFLRERLPECMVPRIFVKLESIPVSTNGKVDTATLPAPDVANTIPNTEGVEPRTVVEERLVQILAGLLNVGEVDVHDNFFLLGGHSLLAAQLLAAIRDVFGIELPLRTVFESPTAARLSIEVANSLRTRVETMNLDELARTLAENEAQWNGCLGREQ